MNQAYGRESTRRCSAGLTRLAIDEQTAAASIPVSRLHGSDPPGRVVAEADLMPADLVRATSIGQTGVSRPGGIAGLADFSGLIRTNNGAAAQRWMLDIVT